jgi:AcrR family transcriptional regulator
MEFPTTARKPRLSAEQRREQILDVTKRIVGEHGFHAVSIDRVAREAGISRPIVYQHFSDLAGLLNALVDRETERALRQLDAVVPADLDGGDRLERLLAALRGYLEAVHADPVTWRLALMPPEGAPELLRERIELGRAAIVAELAQVAAPAIQPRGGDASPDPELTARAMSAVADDAARLLLTDPQRYPVERLVAHARWFLGAFGGPT